MALSPPHSPLEMIASPWRHRFLLGSLTKREILGRYRGSVLGLLWSLFNPLFMLAVYTFVFSVVFQARWGEEGSDSKLAFALILFAGLIVFNLFAECFNRAPGLITSQVNYVKKVIFPLEILPYVMLGSALFHTLISLLVWLAAYALFFGVPPLTIVLVPLVLVPLGLLTLGLSWGLAALGVYLRDVGQLVGILTSVFLFMSPIFYPITALPEAYQPWLSLNPLVPAIEALRDLLFWGRLPAWGPLALYWLVTALVAWIGFYGFQRARGGFADVL